MRFVYEADGVERDLEVRSGRPDATVGDLATALGIATPEGPAPALVIDGRECAADTPLAESGLVLGSWVSAPRRTAPHPVLGPAPFVLRVVAGLDAGAEYPIAAGRMIVGRGRPDGVNIASPLVSQAHCVFAVGSEGDVTVADLGSRNGTDVDGVRLHGPCRIGENTVVGLGGGALVRVLPRSRVGAVRHVNPVREAQPGGTLPFSRPPRAAALPPAAPIVLPTPPRNADKVPFSIAQMLGPVLMAAGIVLVTKEWAFAAFAALSPVMFLTNFVEERTRGRVSIRKGKRAYSAALADASAELRRRHALEVARRHDSAIDPAEAVARATAPGLRLWERRCTADDFQQLCVGYGAQTWQPPVDGGGLATDAEAVALISAVTVLKQTEVMVDLGPGSAIGIEGDREAALAVARSLLAQTLVGSGPADVSLAVFADPDRAPDWDWTKWLPHGAEPTGSARMAAFGADAAEALARALADARTDDPQNRFAIAETEVARPILLAVVDGATLLEGRPNPLRELLAQPAHRVAAIVLTDRMPALCTSVLHVAEDGAARLERITTGETVPGILAAGLNPAAGRRLARGLARFEDPELRIPGAGLPDQLTLIPLLGLREVSANALAGRWRSRRAELRVRAILGVSERDVFSVDLDDDGPHGLIAGTTGSGKSELLRTLIISMAVDADPEHLTFALVDYKGGGALDECARLPHVVGLVTDLDEQLGERALRCMEAELRHREHLLRDAGLGHVRDYQRLRDRDRPDLPAMPRLVVVIDEFATLVKALPDFVDSLVSIAQRGRSLGMHLIMATQRPAGSVNDAIKNNVKLRIALRLESSGDSQDVIDDNAAAAIGSRQWGRAYYRVSAKEVLPIQTALSTGRTSQAQERAPISLAPFYMGMPGQGTGSATGPGGPTDLERLVAAATEAHDRSGQPDPRRPWPEPLPVRLPWSERADQAMRTLMGAPGAVEAAGAAGTAGTVPALALADDPDHQSQYPIGWSRADGNLLCYGAAGSGTTSTLAAAALAEAAHRSPDDLHIYVLDFGSGELAPLTGLPHTAAHVGSAERERQIRLLRLLRSELDDRKAGGGRGCPDWLVLLDNISALMADFDKNIAGMDLLEDLARVYADGPAVGIRFAVSADRYGAVPSAWAALTQQKLLLRLADPGEYGHFELRRSEVPAFVPGRGVLAATKQVVQVHHVGAGLEEEVRRIAGMWPEPTRRPRPVGLLPAQVSVADLDKAPQTEAEPWTLPLGIGDSTLETVGAGLYEHEHLLIAGPQRSGRSLALCLVARTVLESVDPPVVLAFCPRRSPLRQMPGLTACVTEYAELEAALASASELVSEQTSESGSVSEAASEPTSGSQRVLLLVDDAETVDDPDGVLARWIAAAGPGRHLVAAGRAENLRRLYGHWTQTVRESRTGVLLVPDHDLDGDLLGVVLPRGVRMAPVPGRGYLAADGAVTGIQLALAGS